MTHRRTAPPFLAAFGFVLTALTAVVGRGEDVVDPPLGAALYQEHCASCHGEQGEGVADAYADPLIGDRSLEELSRYIDEKMPQGEPEVLDAEQSALIAEHIHEAFYSPTAQFRNKPARIELSRLTVRQYRQALADLIASFVGPGDWGDDRGLRAEYHASRNPRGRRNSVIQRIDPQVRFDFGEATPDAELIPSNEEYSARWTGSVIAPDDGEYEFVVETENGMRLFVNNPDVPLIDASVKSGDGREFQAVLPLLGGRAYYLQLELIKSKPEKTASMTLKWKRPGHALETIPQRSLWPQTPPERLVIATPFPPDDRSVGYERGTMISREWDEATTHAALEAADWIATRRLRLADTREDAEDRNAKLRAFALRFVERAFRRPLEEPLHATFVDRHFDEAPDEETAIKRVVLLALKSPRFLYRELGHADNDPWSVASRLSFALWDSLPDGPLLEAAARDELRTAEQVRAQADRMVQDHRAQAKFHEFCRQWLRIDHFGDLAKDESAHPGFTPELRSDLRTSLELGLDAVYGSEASDFRELLTGTALFLNGRLAAYYGVDLPEDADFQRVEIPNEPRRGVMSHPYLLSGFAYHGSSSPIHRGVFLSRSLLGRTLKQPPVAVAPLAPDLHADLTTRERVILQTSPDMCQSCHTMINGLGFSLENFDAVGRYREVEKSQPIDASGEYFSRTGDLVRFSDVRELAEFLAGSEDATEAFVRQMFHFQVKQAIRAYGESALPDLQRSFVADGFHIRRLMASIAAEAALRPGTAASADPAQARLEP
ncbi:MAG: DUF1592 domain-containing protein [Planctomyces sp.]|nr:DUF1592 domain-containing protein [Planctomyces sp.]